MTTVPRPAAITLWTADLAQVVSNTIRTPDWTPTSDDLARLAEICHSTGLDLFAGQIYAIPRKNKKAGTVTMSVQLGVDGWRTIAGRHPEYGGQGPTRWAAADGQWRDVWTDTTPPAAASATVYRVVGGLVVETTAVATWTESADTYQGKPKGQWADRPVQMLGKAAEMLALRKAFPLEHADSPHLQHTPPASSGYDTVLGDVSPPDLPPPPAPDPEPAPPAKTAADEIPPGRQELYEQLRQIAHQSADLRTDVKRVLADNGAEQLDTVGTAVATLPAAQLVFVETWATNTLADIAKNASEQEAIPF